MHWVAFKASQGPETIMISHSLPNPPDLPVSPVAVGEVLACILAPSVLVSSRVPWYLFLSLPGRISCYSRHTLALGIYLRRYPDTVVSIADRDTHAMLCRVQGDGAPHFNERVTLV